MRLLLALITILHVPSVFLLPENYYDEDSSMYIDNIPYNHRYSKALQSVNELDNKLLYTGHDEMHAIPFRDDYELEYEDFNSEFVRPTRSQTKTDNFVRFGRGNSDFVRFGRNPYQSHQFRADQNFVRFGRNLAELESKKRSKRSAPVESKPKRRNQDDFLRFGRGGDDSFVRYGRNFAVNGMNSELDAPTKPKGDIYRQLAGSSYNLPEKYYLNVPLLIILKKLDELKEKN